MKTSLDIKPKNSKWNIFFNFVHIRTSKISCVKCNSYRYERHANYLVCSCCGTYVEGTMLL